ncbi:DUF4231 domain-containing protein [Nonomuraea sp. NPDC052265]|uniref:DUF4231 domain-containing protein n=1 Tax=Nonomuraea sp. NPDC052265 TaxID=3364374 RepID=UPI0037CC1AF3
MSSDDKPLSEMLIDCEAEIAAVKRKLVLAVAGIFVFLALATLMWILAGITSPEPAGSTPGGVAFLLSLATIALSVFWWNRREAVKALEVRRAKLNDQKRRTRVDPATDDTGVLEPQAAYRERIPDLISEYRNRASYYRRIHSWLQSVVIVGSIAASSITSLAIAIQAVQWIAAIVTFGVGVAAGFIGYFKYRERSMYLRQTADAIEQEWQAAELQIRHYRSLSPRELLSTLAETIELLREEQRKREQQLEQPSDESRPSAPQDSVGS